MFCDELKLKLIAGKGGDGCVSFRREKFVPKGGPDGGNGGHGGHIIFKVNPQLNTLSHLANRKTYQAENGQAGRGKNMYGKGAENLILEVPQGTIVFAENKSHIIADLNKKNDQVTIVKGGKGGLGNSQFANSIHQAPKFAEKGEPGEEKEVQLELKLVADTGIIGLPSAGKSTLISVISNARPKIGDYPFTTLIPNLGVVNMDRFGGEKTQSFVVADIPGLIEGAHVGKGLGDQFLRHVSRTKLLVHLLDGHLENPGENYKIIRKELKAFDKNLIKLKEIIVINKIDLLNPESEKALLKEMKKVSKKAQILTISAVTKVGLKPLVFEIFKQLNESTIQEKLEKNKRAKSEILILKPDLDRTKFEIEKITKKKDHKIFRISGRRIEQLVLMTDLSNREGLERVYKYIQKSGIQVSTEKRGATFGDFYKIKENKIPYRK